jgi:arylsulfatase A-like enzyme
VQQRDDGSRADPDKSDQAESFIPAERHKNLYMGKTPPRRQNYLKPPHNKPALERNPAGTIPLGAASATRDDVILARMRMMKAVDESTGLIVEALEKKNMLDDTMVVFTSDHGFFYGEHCLGAERRLAYEETIRIPLLVRYPRRFSAGSNPAQFVLNLDISASALAAAELSPPRPFHGRPLWSQPFRSEVLIEYFSDITYPRIRNMGYSAVRTDRWKYIRYRDMSGADEIYDLRNDPFELENLIHDKKAPLRQLGLRLDKLLAETGANV